MDAFREKDPPRQTCPQCGGTIQRTPRAEEDRQAALDPLLRRYRCQQAGCGWQGLLPRQHDILFMMQFVEGSRYQTAHYALATGFMALGYVLFKTVSGDLQQALGYQAFFLWVVLCAVPVFVLMRWLPLREDAREEPPNA